MNSLYVALGGALGSVVRFWLGTAVAERAGAHFWGTLFVNVTGSYIIGLAAALGKDHAFTRHFVIIGILGGYTTFSSFSLQTLELFQGGQIGWALGNIGLSVVLCLVSVWLGWQSARVFA
jgi:CrcB protein